jgi:hypothetical protein
MPSAPLIRLTSKWLFALLGTILLSPCFGQQQSKYSHPATDPAHNLTVKEFFKDLGANFAGLVSTHSILPLAVGAAGTSLATIPEQGLQKHFARGDMWGAWADPGKYIGHPFILAGIGGSLFAASRKSDDRRFRSLSYSLIQGSLTSAAIVAPLKAGFHRLRPNNEDHAAFPSGHATHSFMYATIFAEHYGWKAAIPGYVLATYVSATRLEERKHHLTDVAAGAAIGYLVGHTISRRMRQGKPGRVAWQIYPSRRGFAGSMQVALP